MIIRKGQCNHCGCCCIDVDACIFKPIEKDGLLYCEQYDKRPENCQKWPEYPEGEVWERCKDKCGYYFIEE